MIYVASNYSHPDPEVRTQRYEAVLAYTAGLLARGVYAFSPIAYGHQFAVSQSFEVRWEFWKPFDMHMISLASEVWVLTLPGWAESVGVAAEIEYANRLGRPVKYVEPEGT